MNRLRLIILTILVATVLSEHLAEAKTLSLDQYVNEVVQQNGSFKESEASKAFAENKEAEAALVFSPRVFSNLTISDDSKPTFTPAFEGSSRDTRAFQLGFEAQHSFGLNHKIYSSYDYLNINGTDSQIVPISEVNKHSFVYEMSLPLWANAFGRRIRSESDSSIFSNRSLQAQESYKQLQKIVAAKSTYWRLKHARDTYGVQKDLLKQAESFLSWTQRRVSDRLLEQSDLVQAKASLNLRKLDLEQALTLVATTEQEFNVEREVGISEHIGELDSWPSPKEISLKISKDSRYTRGDLQSVALQQRSESFEAQASAEIGKPQLDLVGGYSTNGQQTTFRNAYDDSATNRYPAFNVGLKFSAPLDFSGSKKVRQLAQIKERSVKSALERKQYEVQKEAEGLFFKFEQAKKHLELGEALVSSLETRLNVERERLKRGRSTTFQVLSFEQEYSQAQINVVNYKFQLISLALQSELFLVGEQ